MDDLDLGMFGDLSKDIGRQRLLCIGFGLGLIVAAMCPWEVGRYTLAFFGLFIVVVRTMAQKFWPDRMPDDPEQPND